MGTLRVLVVDDNVHAAESLVIVAGLWNFEARAAFSGPEAITSAEAFRPRVVLLDISLPGMDGYAVARALRGRPEFADLRLIAMTGFGLEEDFERSKSAGFDHHLVKPVDFDALKAILDGLFQSE